MVLLISFLLIILLIILFLIKENNSIKFTQNFIYYSIILIVIFLVISIIIYPSESVEAAYEGLVIWATVVLPALLPFFIGSELLIGLGVVKFIGILLEPIMRPIFNVPGEGSFAFAMSITSGYPVGARIISKLRSDNTISVIEAQRLLSFCSTSGPLFMIGAVAVGMFQSSEIGFILATTHYAAAILVGIIFSFYKGRSRTMFNPSEGRLLFRAFQQLEGKKNKSLSLGILLGDAVKNSLNTILMVGGFIVIFSVIIRILEILKIFSFFTSIIYFFLKPLKINAAIIRSFLSGLFEITIGCKLVSETAHIQFITKIALVNFIIAWSGFSIHAQSLSILGDSGIKGYIYIFSKMLHGIFAFLLTYIFFPVYKKFFSLSISVYNTYQELNIYKRFLLNCKLSIELFISVLIVFLIISLLISLILFIKNSVKKG